MATAVLAEWVGYDIECSAPVDPTGTQVSIEDRGIVVTHVVRPELVAEFTRPGQWENRLLDDYVDAAAAERPDGVAVVDRGRAWTFREIAGRVDRAAAVLGDLGVLPGDVVSWQLPNWIDGIVVHHAALRVGAVSNPIVPIYREHEVRFILGQARSKVLFVPREFRGFDHLELALRLRDELDDLTHVVVVDRGADPSARPEGLALSFETLLATTPAAAPRPDRSANDVALLLYTSGTTASPKGALHTHNTLDFEVRNNIDVFGLDPSDVVFMASPITHVTGMLYAVLTPFTLRCPVVLQDVWNPAAAVALIDEHRCTFSVSATPFLHGILEQLQGRRDGASPLRFFACGGADVPPDLVRSATRRLGAFVTRIYGCSEFPNVTCCDERDPLDRRADTDGRVLEPSRLRVVGADGATVAADVEGDVEVIGPEMFLGYLDGALDAACFTADGWFRTGDIGVLDAEGYLRITGRSKDIIIRGGENISAREVEDLLFMHPAVAEVAVVGVPDPVLVERVCAFVVPSAPATGPELDLAALVGFLATHGIARQKYPERLELVTELPRTSSGKVQKFVLRASLTT